MNKFNELKIDYIKTAHLRTLIYLHIKSPAHYLIIDVIHTTILNILVLTLKSFFLYSHKSNSYLILTRRNSKQLIRYDVYNLFQTDFVRTLVFFIIVE